MNDRRDYYRVLAPHFKAKVDSYGVTLTCRLCNLILQYPADPEPARIHRDTTDHVRRNHSKLYNSPTP